MRHELKTWPSFFEAIMDGKKTFEVRKNDRGFQTGDELLLIEWDPDGLAYRQRTGRELLVEVLYVLNGWGIEPGFVVMGITIIRKTG